MTEEAKPSPLLAALCGLFAPGAGLCYAGRWRLALGVALTYVAAAVVVPVVLVSQGLDLSRLPALIKAAALSLWVPALVFGVLAATLAPSVAGPRPRWRHPWWLFGFILLTHAGASIARGQVAEHVVTVVVVSGQLPRLQLEPGDAFVVPRGDFDLGTVNPGELVAVRRDDGDHIAQVVSVEDASLTLDLGVGALVTVAPSDLRGRAVRAVR